LISTKNIELISPACSFGPSSSYQLSVLFLSPRWTPELKKELYEDGENVSVIENIKPDRATIQTDGTDEGVLFMRVFIMSYQTDTLVETLVQILLAAAAVFSL
jgi:hypothetical protein